MSILHCRLLVCAQKLKAKIRQPRMLIRASSERPVELPFGLGDWEFIDACVSRMHQPFRVELPIFVAVGPKPIARVIVILVGKPDGNPVVQKCPDFLNESVVEFSGPLSCEQCDDLLTPVGELCSISPARNQCVCKGDFFRVTAVPAVFCQSNLLNSVFQSKGR